MQRCVLLSDVDRVWYRFCRGGGFEAGGVSRGCIEVRQGEKDFGEGGLTATVVLGFPSVYKCLIWRVV